MNKETRIALFASITHWKRVAADPKGRTVSISNCALCQLYHPMGDYFRYAEFSCGEGCPVLSCCEGCPVFEKTLKTGCRDTPYSDTRKAIRLEDWEGAARFAKEELRFLISLLPEDVEFVPDVTINEFYAAADKIIGLRKMISAFEDRTTLSKPLNIRGAERMLCSYFHETGPFFKSGKKCCEDCPIGNNCKGTPVIEYGRLAFEYLQTDDNEHKQKLTSKAQIVARQAVEYLNELLEII